MHALYRFFLRAFNSRIPTDLNGNQLFRAFQDEMHTFHAFQPKSTFELYPYHQGWSIYRKTKQSELNMYTEVVSQAQQHKNTHGILTTNSNPTVTKWNEFNKCRRNFITLSQCILLECNNRRLFCSVM